MPAKLQFADNGLLNRMDQGAWVVVIAQYAQAGGQQMPRRITALNEAAKVRLVIDRWTFY